MIAYFLSTLIFCLHLLSKFTSVLTTISETTCLKSISKAIQQRNLKSIPKPRQRHLNISKPCCHILSPKHPITQESVNLPNRHQKINLHCPHQISQISRHNPKSSSKIKNIVHLPLPITVPSNKTSLKT